MVVFGQKWLYSGKSGFIWAKLLSLDESCCIRAKWLYSGNIVVFKQSGCIRAKWFYSCNSGCNRAKELVFG